MTRNVPATETTGTSPSSSGPAGALFEGQVAAHYLLTMLANADPRGLPGVSIERIELQRAGEGHPLDDVVVRGINLRGEQSVLELQVKRAITFSPADAVFKEVVEQLAKAFQTLDVTHQRHQFAVATQRISSKVTGSYQDVLRWARETESASVYFGRLNRKNVANPDMRTFVETLRTHLQMANSASDDETVWQILRRLQVLIFDYDAPGSQSLDLALERARNVLDPADAARASALWRALIASAIGADTAGGAFDRERLLFELADIDSFRLLGARHNRVQIANVSEAAAQARAEFRRDIGGITLTRSAHLDAVREACDHGRYVEIRGEPGVGKSALLGMLVDQVLAEGRALVLTPHRTISEGWLAFKSALKIEVGAEAFLADLANDGGAALFIDSLDFFDDASKRATVIDLVRAAASVPAFHVIVTVRTNFGNDERNWLPSDTLAKLVPAPPVVINELGDAEIEELRNAAPSLRALLADRHPARIVARNLFRLSRLLEVQGSTDQLRSEVDLLERWWTTADGPIPNRRERARILADLADTVIGIDDRLKARGTSSAVDALIDSGTLREDGLDQLVFRHDVLRDWAVAARLHDAPHLLGQLPLTRVAPASLARGVELGARMALERSEDGRPWSEYLTRVSADGSHASWRRWSILAVLRSELAFTLLERASPTLLENDGALLRELIRTAIAVESRPFAETLTEFGIDIGTISAGIYSPKNASWFRLASWLLERRDSLPVQAIPDVVELFQSLSTSMLFEDPLTPIIASTLADWLNEIEDAQDFDPLTTDQPRFARELRHHEMGRLGTAIRRAFLLMAYRVPERAQDYLRRLSGRRSFENTIRNIVNFRGSLARAAPAELVELTLAGLIPKEREEEYGNDTFTYLDVEFLPGSPARGLFLELLDAAPDHLLNLARRLVNHAISTRAGEREPGEDGITLALPTGFRFFPWTRSYYWSRQTDGCHAVQAGLLALEVWAHARIEQGDTPERVIGDVLGPDGSPAAYLLVAVDVLISHWPKTARAAIPFLGSPELLTLDRDRWHLDVPQMMDVGSGRIIEPGERVEPVRFVDLKKRPSRRHILEALLATYAHDESADRGRLHDLLATASTRLGPLEPDDTVDVPRFMARYALNRIDPANWRLVDGKRTYVSPLAEAQHVKVQSMRDFRAEDRAAELIIQGLLEDRSRSSEELAEQAVLYAQRLSVESHISEDALHARTLSIVSAAIILARDGSDALCEQHEGWARDVFAQTFANAGDVIGSHLRDGIRFNPIAIAALGIIHLWRRCRRAADRDALLQVAGRNDSHAAQGFGAGLAVILEVDPRLVPALLRCALIAQIQPTYDWDDPQEMKDARQAQHREQVATAIEAEVTWLNGDGPPPAWPRLPPPIISVRQGPRIGGRARAAQPAQADWPRILFRSQSAGLWVRQLTKNTKNAEALDLTWIVSFVDAYADWTAEANGAGLEQYAEFDSRCDKWNDAFVSLLARVFTTMTPDKAAAHVARLTAVPDRAFFSICSLLVPAIDWVYFNGQGLDLEVALNVRALLGDRLVQTASWRHERDRSGLAVELHIGPAIAPLFFNQYNSLSGASVYLLEKGINQLDPFLPGLMRLVNEGPVPFTALLTMNLLEVSPRSTHLQFLLTSALVWLQRQPANAPLWVDCGLGARVAGCLETMIRADKTLSSPLHPFRTQMEEVLARLVQEGVAEAYGVEQLLGTNPALPT